MLHGLHILGADSKEVKKTDYTPYVEAASGLGKGIAEGLTSASQAQLQARVAEAQAEAAREQAQASSNTVWYVAGGMAVVATLVALLLRARG